ncbi:MAG: SpoIIE family protein phosphatase [Clostridia bacterium]|nr:SpoIIE family protein phosphatase [Clostridia bacterium]
MRLSIPILLNILLVVTFYSADKRTKFKLLPQASKQIIIGVMFGGVSAFSSSFGVAWLGTIVNVRDAAPLSAGLIFGAPAGIIAGFIGGLYRWFSVYWGGGEYTRLACTAATILAGFIAAGLRKLMFDDKKPTWGYGICAAVVCEILHMILIFLTNMDNSSQAFEFVRGASLPMVLGNAIAVGLSLVFVSLLSHERLTRKKGSEQIAQTFQRWLLMCIVIAYLITSTFTFILQNGMAKIETQELFTTAINDVKTDVRGKSDAYMLAVTKNIADRYEADPTVSLALLAEEYDVIEINVVAQDGLILHSTDASLSGAFNMNSSEQSKAFMVLTQGETSLVQEYGPIGIDGTTMRKYAGITLAGGGYIQVGYSTEQFHDMLDEFVVDVTKNRHVSANGFIAVCDENLNLVTETFRNGAHISTIGIVPNAEMNNGEFAKALCEAEIVNSETGYREAYVYVFTFVEGYCIIAAMPKSDVMFMRDASLYTSVFMQVLIFASLFILIYILIKRVIINNLKKVNGTLAQITNGNLNVTVDVRSNEEFASLSDDINSTVATLKHYIDEAAARFDKDLEIAKTIQHSALPSVFPPYPDRKDFSIFASMDAAKEVGGDFYDFYLLDDHRLAFVMADVSGKGIPGAMFMMTAKTLLKSHAESGLAVHDVFTQVNSLLCENNEAGMFVTAWMGILDLETGLIRYANAGHNPPVIRRRDGTYEYLKGKANFVLAGMEGVRYREQQLQLQQGDEIYLYTDGITEAHDPSNQLFGEGRLLSSLNSAIHLPVEDICKKVKTDVDAFVGTAEQFDDITMMCIRLNETESKMLSVKPTMDAIPQAAAFVEENLEKFEVPMGLSARLMVALDEIFSNIVRYSGASEAQIRLVKEADTLRLIFRDNGKPYNPLDAEAPDITASAEDRTIGGLGIFMVRKMMDNVEYEYTHGMNKLTLSKKLT